MSTESKIRERLEFLQLDDASVRHLQSAKELLDPKLDELIGDFYRHVISSSTTRHFFADEASVERARRAQTAHWRDLLFGGIPGESYYRRAQRIGLAHEAIGLTMNPYLAGYCYVLQHFTRILVESRDPELLTTVLPALHKAAFFDIECVTESYLESKNGALRRILQHTEQFANTLEPLEAESASQGRHLAEHSAKVAQKVREMNRRVEAVAATLPAEAGRELRELARDSAEQTEALARRSSLLSQRLEQLTETARARRDLYKLHFPAAPQSGWGRLAAWVRTLLS